MSCPFHWRHFLHVCCHDDKVSSRKKELIRTHRIMSLASFLYLFISFISRAEVISPIQGRAHNVSWFWHSSTHFTGRGSSPQRYRKVELRWCARITPQVYISWPVYIKVQIRGMTSRRTKLARVVEHVKISLCCMRGPLSGDWARIRTNSRSASYLFIYTVPIPKSFLAFLQVNSKII